VGGMDESSSTRGGTDVVMVKIEEKNCHLIMGTCYMTWAARVYGRFKLLGRCPC